MVTVDRIHQLTEFLKEDPDDAFLLFALAREYTKAKNHTDALNTYAHLRQLHPDYVGLYYHLGQLQEVLGKHVEARDTYEAGIVVATKSGDMHAKAELMGVLLQLADG